MHLLVTLAVLGIQHPYRIATVNLGQGLYHPNLVNNSYNSM